MFVWMLMVVYLSPISSVWTADTLFSNLAANIYQRMETCKENKKKISKNNK